MSENLKLTPLGDFIVRRSGAVPMPLWRDITKHLSRMMDEDADWELFLSELQEGAKELSERASWIFGEAQP